MKVNDLGEVAKKSRVDSRRESYQFFFDCQWVNDLGEVTKDTRVLARIFFDLAVSWRGAANTHYMPSHTVHLLEVFANVHNPYGKDFKEIFTAELMNKIHSSLSNMKRKEVQRAIEEICEEMDQAFTKDPRLMFDGEAFWKDFATNSEIRYMLIGSQRMCYGAIYYAYENFVLQVYQLLSGSVNYRMRNAKEFSKDFTAVFGDSLCQFCWSDPAIRIAGLARNALVHNGGRVTDDLAREPHGFLVEDGEIQVMPNDTKALHDLLKEGVTKLVNEATTKLPKDTARLSV